ncbi:hypothetical protein B0H17DRAFT_1193097 [Mycena rosella]|uniref:DUF6533 domain-containing protein n=1 Tax=Mycena rosella TaxID=1033263 RepID=A0AAD7GU86_MYCRO|nr:hypothetical protein B0H17DRAFT_1193097 [Mycena rosella]
MASVSPAEELELLQLIADAQTTNYLAAAGITVLVFEHISTFPEEVKFVWKSRLSLWSVLYVWIRYFTLIAVAVDASFMFTEMKSSSSEMFNCTVVTISVDFVLVLRVWILYGRSRRLLYILVPLMAVEIITLIITGTLSMIPLKALPRYFTFYAVPSLAMAVLMFSMTLYKCSEHLYAVRGQRMPLITLFLKDGVILFLLILVFSIVELTIWNNARPTLAQVPTIPGTSLSAVVGARVLLNIKNLATEVDDTTIPTIELSDISHRQRPFAAKARIPWYLQTGELSNSEVLSGEIH